MLACALARPLDGSGGKECVIARAMESRCWRARLHVPWTAQAERSV